MTASDCICEPNLDCPRHGEPWDCGDCGATDIPPRFHWCPFCYVEDCECWEYADDHHRNADTTLMQVIFRDSAE